MTDIVLGAGHLMTKEPVHHLAPHATITQVLVQTLATEELAWSSLTIGAELHGPKLTVKSVKVRREGGSKLSL